jgi:hypothetical protein
VPFRKTFGFFELVTETAAIMGQFSGVILCFLSAFMSHNCEGGPCFCAAIGVGLVCLWTWASIRSPGLFATLGKWQSRLRLTLLNPELYKYHSPHDHSQSLYRYKEHMNSPDWVVAVNFIFTGIGFFLFFWAIHDRFLS